MNGGGRRKNNDDVYGGALHIGITQTNRGVSDDITGSFRVLSRMSGNGIDHGGDIISPKAIAVVDNISNNRGIHLVYSEFIGRGVEYVAHELKKRGW